MGAERSATGWTAAHGALFLIIWILAQLLVPVRFWPFYLLIPLAIYVGVALALPGLRRTFPSLQFGRCTGYPLLTAIVLSAATSGVLVAYQLLAQPDSSLLAARLPALPVPALGLVAICFSIGNATLEELIFRGILYESVLAERGAGVAIAFTSICFGLGHYNGYPPGIAGASLAGMFGIALAILRWWTGGLALATGVHVCADATIFAIVVQGNAIG